MKVNSRFGYYLRKITGVKEEVVEVPEGILVGDFVRFLSSKYGERFEELVLDESGNVKTGIRIFVNRRNVIFLEGTRTVLKLGDTISILKSAR